MAVPEHARLGQRLLNRVDDTVANDLRHPSARLCVHIVQENIVPKPVFIALVILLLLSIVFSFVGVLSVWGPFAHPQA